MDFPFYHPQREAFVDKTEVLDILKERQNRIKQVEVKKVRTAFDDKNRVMVVNDEFSIADPQIFNQLCHHMKVPSTFLRKTDPDLAEKVVKHLAPKVKDVVLLTEDAKALRAFTKRLPYTDPVKLVSTVLDKFDHFDQIDLNEKVEQLNVTFVSGKIETRPKVDDIVKAGVSLRFSDYGIINPEVETASYRLVCTNGMIHPDFLFKIAVNAKLYTEMMDNILRGVETATKIFENVVAPKMKAAAEMKLDPMQAIRRIARENRLTPDEIDRVMAAYAIEPMETMWGVTNAFTRAANQFSSYDTRRRLQTIGGAVVRTADVPHCTACAARL